MLTKTIDNTYGEGGGQLVRSALSLSLCYNMPVKIINIRVKRRKQGLKIQKIRAIRIRLLISNRFRDLSQ